MIRCVSLQNGNNKNEIVTIPKDVDQLTRRYQRLLAFALCAVMTAMPFTAFAAELPAEAQPAPAEISAEQTSLLIETGSEPAPAPEVPQEEPVKDPNEVRVFFNSQLMELQPSARLHEGTTFVPVRAFFEAMGCTVTWDPSVKKVFITRGEELTMELQPDSRLARANGRCWYMAKPCINLNGSTMIPVRDAAKVFSGSVAWNGTTKTVFMAGGQLLKSGDEYYNQEDLLWIARIVWCESGNQPLDGKVAVANVIINRMNDDGFPNTAEGVIFDRRFGVQFTPSTSKKIYCEPTEQCWLAAKLALEGYETAPGCFYFVSNKATEKSWAGRNRTVYGVIGGHTFFL